MATDYNSEFNKIFGGGGCTLNGYDWSKLQYFDGTNTDSCYSNEAALVSSLTSEAYNTYGFEVDYYIKNISTKRDELLGEDPLENIVRRFKLSVYTENIPQMQKQYQMQGMLYTELITLQCTIAHFDEASQYDYERTKIAFEKYVPKIGDIMYMGYSDKYYEVVNVKPFADGSVFNGVPITYQFVLRIWRNNHEDVFENTDLPINEYTSLAETFDMVHDTSTVDSSSDMLATNDELKKPDVALQVYKKNDMSEKIYKDNDPWGGW